MIRKPLWEISDTNLRHLKAVTGRPGSVAISDPFAALKGLLAEYSDETVDSVELVRAVRERRSL